MYPCQCLCHIVGGGSIFEAVFVACLRPEQPIGLVQKGYMREAQGPFLSLSQFKMQTAP